MSQRDHPLLPLILDDVPAGLARVLAQEGVPYRHRSRGRFEGRFVLFDSHRRPRPALALGQRAIDVGSLRDVSRPDPFQGLTSQGSARHRWQIGGLTISEEISRIDRRAVRRNIIEPLRNAIELSGGIWLNVAAFPFPYRSALNFRIDYDRYDPQDFDETLLAIAGQERATSHYVNAAAHRAHGDALTRLAGLDVGSHGYYHHTYLTYQENLLNVRRGIESLQQHGIEPRGFVAPGGRFNRGLLSALEDLKVGHSSEFGLAYDELPFFPGDGDLLQIPVHPVCLGIFLEAVRGEGPRRVAATQQAVRAAADYLCQIVQSKYRAGEPVFLYGHPTGRLGRYPQVLKSVFDATNRFGAIWRTTLSEFAAWWRARACVRLSVVRHGDQYVVTADERPAEHCLSIEYWRGRHVARMPLAERVLQFSPSALAYENGTQQRTVRPVRFDRPEGLRGRIRRMIDFERETPIGEIGRGSWRNLAKRTLRRLRK